MKFTIQELRTEVLAFALLMEARLREKDASKHSTWKSMTDADLMMHASSKCLRLEDGVRYTFSGRTRHAVDLANYCMMIADVAGGLDIGTLAPPALPGITGKLSIMGQIDVVEADQSGGKYSYERALLIDFESDEDIRAALEAMQCKFI